MIRASPRMPPELLEEKNQNQYQFELLNVKIQSCWVALICHTSVLRSSSSNIYFSSRNTTILFFISLVSVEKLRARSLQVKLILFKRNYFARPPREAIKVSLGSLPPRSCHLLRVPTDRNLLTFRPYAIGNSKAHILVERKRFGIVGQQQRLQ